MIQRASPWELSSRHRLHTEALEQLGQRPEGRRKSTVLGPGVVSSMARCFMNPLHRQAHRGRDLAVIWGAKVVIEVAVVANVAAFKGLVLHKDVVVEVDRPSATTNFHAVMGLDASLGRHGLEVKLVLESLHQGGGELPRVTACRRRDLGSTNDRLMLVLPGALPCQHAGDNGLA